MSYTLVELAKLVGGQIVGDQECVISGIAPLDQAHAGQISFLFDPRLRKALAHTKATAVILGAADQVIGGVNALLVDNPKVAYAHIAALFRPTMDTGYGIHSTAVVSKDSNVHKQVWIAPGSVIEAGVTIAADVRIGPGCVVGSNSVIGAGCCLAANVTIMHDTIIGKRAVIHSGAVIGSDGFGFANDKGVWIKIPQLGRVRIGDDVEIGASTAIDRGALDDTIIEDGVKIDNLVHIAHNVFIGAHTIIAASTAIAGSTRIGKYCAFGGVVGVNGHVEIADKVQFTGMSRVTKSIKKPGIYSSGTPLQLNKQWQKNSIRFKQLDDMARRLRHLEKVINNKGRG